ncbi:DNA repair protein UVH3 isoform X1 [Pistacia vera]|uniref:DNA repair protein UVH3 isoform X1 n=1 Tax=Pistacia vera TaxID=55513 RepID=UPI001263E1A5|nr:DNA repair protein UVH3 isoform X1 [Pistacia vera]
MGVHGLWDLLAPVGRRVSVETLAGKRLAIDASIWMVQFMKAMRDEKGEMVRNAHLIGFFRRICKLLFLKTKPVFVFDGGTPALKRRTVIARRRQRENAQAKIRKTAEKLLINHLKTMRLKELAKDLEDQRKKQNNASKGEKILSDQIAVTWRSLGKNDAALASSNKGNRDAMLAASATANLFQEDGDEDEEMMMPIMDGNVDPAVIAALPPSMRLLVQKQEHDVKGKKILYDDDLDQTDLVGSNEERSHVASKSNDCEKLDEMLAASIAAEEHGSLTDNASITAASIPFEEEDGDEDEEMILPAMHGNVDPAVLAALPPSMQLDLLVQMRERLMAENRQKYQKVKKAPEKFSELQIRAYLKTVAFRREIDEVQKAAAGRGVGGIQTSRIASEANREFIFSSSFTGDKQVLASAKVGSTADKQQQKPSRRPSSASRDNASSCSESNAVTGLAPEERGAVFDDIETYLDERGRVRVSKVRAMGIRMTRDLQRNLDLMREIEQERVNTNNTIDVESNSLLRINEIGSSNNFSGKNEFVETSPDDNSGFVNKERNKQSMFKNEKVIQISFEDNGENNRVDDDDVFARLAAGSPVEVVSTDNTPSKEQSFNSISDSDWEEGNVEEKVNSLSNDVNAEINPAPYRKEGNINDESEVEWEGGPSGAPKSSSACFTESGKTVPRGHLEEEANLQEAIRRSLLDLCSEKSDYVLSDDENCKRSGENACDDVGFLDEKNNTSGSNLLGENATRQDEPVCEIRDGENLGTAGGVSDSQVTNALESQLKSVVHNPNNKETLSKSCEKYPSSLPEQSRQDASEGRSLYGDVARAESVATFGMKEQHFVQGQCFDASNKGGELATFTKRCSEDNSHGADLVFSDMSGSILVDDKKNNSEVGCSAVLDSYMSDAILVGDKKNTSEVECSALLDDKESELVAESSIMISGKKNDCEAEPLHQTIVSSDPYSSMVDSSLNESMYKNNTQQNLAAERTHDCEFSGREHNIEKSELKENDNMQVEFTEANLEEEMLILDQECMNLEDEQRKLERNAESVSSEMFAECQELLQMFGLPYIIAPMEAEAQCAFMEIVNLVDGVVTDDSDVFLFGAQSVYKNIFDDRKYVETYFMQDIEKELGLTREKLIRMALLLGSDYTEGISGIGIVNAIEVVNAFPEEDGLHQFREWIESPDPTILGKFDVQTVSNARKRASKVGDNSMSQIKCSREGLSVGGQNVLQADENKWSADHSQDIKKIFMDNHRNVSKNWHIPSSFPSEVVISAYTCPQVDKSTEPFSWGKPDLFVLRKFCWDKFAWGSQKSDELLLPVLKEYEKRETQLRLEAFYTFNERFAKIRSKRIKKAVKAITGNQSLELMGEAGQEVPKSRKKKRADHLENGNSISAKDSEESVAGAKNNREKSTPKQLRKRRVTEKIVSSERENPESLICADGGRNTNEISHGIGRGRGRRRKRLCADLTETSSSDGVGGNEKLEGPQELRRSSRSRKSVNYCMNDQEIDDGSKIWSNKECSNEEAGEQQLFEVHGLAGDASADPFRKEQHKAGDPLLEEGSSGDYLERGGGFCVDEGEIGEPNVSQNEDPFCEAEFSKDHLIMGGGFCLDESES